MATFQTDKKKQETSFFSGVAVLAISTLIVKVIGMFYKIPMMAYLGAEGMGSFNSAYDIYSLFFVIATTGIPVAISILVAESNAQNRFRNAKKIYKISIATLGVIGAIGTVILAIFDEELAVLIRNDAARYCIFAISPTLVLICLSSAMRGYFQGNQNMLPTAISQVIEALGKLFLGLGFAIFAIKQGHTMPIVAAYAVFGLTLGVAISLLFLILYKLLSKPLLDENAELRIDKTPQIIKNIFAIAVPITLSSTILSLTKIIDMTMILGRLNDIGYSQAEANSIYGSYSTMAVSIFNLPATLVTAIALPLVPLLSSTIEAKDSVKATKIVNLSFKITSLVAFPTGLGISVFSKSILSLLFSNQSTEIEYVAPLLSLLGLSVFSSAMITVTNAILQAHKQVNKPIIAMIIGTVVKIATAYLFIGNKNINIYGAPISTFLSTVVIVCVNLYFILKATGRLDSVYKLFVRPCVAAIISIIVGIGAYVIIDMVLVSHWTILPVILIVCIVYALCVLKLKIIDENEISMLSSGDKLIKILKKIHLV